MENRITPEKIEDIKRFQVFVFGSNLEGRHGAGAAWLARSKGWAITGRGVGWWSIDDHASFAIPTKGVNLETLPLEWIEYFVNYFIEKAKTKPEWTFLVTEIGCGLAGYTPEQIAPLFKDAVDVKNIHLPKRFWDVLK